MKKLILVILLLLSFGFAKSQSIGFSYFFPKNGYFSNPIAPLSFNLPIKFGNNVLINTGFTLNNIGGMSMSGFGEKYNSNIALMGPFQTLNIRLAPTIRLNFKKAKLDFIFGGFGFMNFNEKLLKSNFDEMLMQANEYQMLNTDVELNSKLFAYGYYYGSKLTFHAKKKVWIYLGANYYNGSKDVKIDYSYYALKSNSIIEGSESFNDVFLQYEGLEIVFGVVLKKLIMDNYNLISIIGNTASGKTKLAVRLAEEINSEIISADSRQVFKGMDIGTGKDLNEYKNIPYHLIDIKNPGYEYNVFEYQQDFFKIFSELRNRNITPIMCGGSGMYIDSVLRSYNLVKVDKNEDLRDELNKLSLTELVNKLKENRTPHNTTDTETKERAIRAIEIDEYYKTNPSSKPNFPKINSLNIGVYVSREENRELITKRLTERLENGMIEEVEELLKKGFTAEQLMFYGLEYRYLTLYIKGKITFDEMKSTLNTKIHQFMKRQTTWWRRMEKNGVKIHWVNAMDGVDVNLEKIIKLLN